MVSSEQSREGQLQYSSAAASAAITLKSLSFTSHSGEIPYGFVYLAPLNWAEICAFWA